MWTTTIARIGAGAKAGRRAATIRRASAALALLAPAACSPAFPPVATGPGDAAFKATIAELYRPGRPAAELKADLVTQGFAIALDPARGFGSAVWAPANLPCHSRTRVDWAEDRRGRITRIQAKRLDCS